MEEKRADALEVAEKAPKGRNAKKKDAQDAKPVMRDSSIF